MASSTAIGLGVLPAWPWPFASCPWLRRGAMFEVRPLIGCFRVPLQRQPVRHEMRFMGLGCMLCAVEFDASSCAVSMVFKGQTRLRKVLMICVHPQPARHSELQNTRQQQKPSAILVPGTLSEMIWNWFWINETKRVGLPRRMHVGCLADPLKIPPKTIDPCRGHEPIRIAQSRPRTDLEQQVWASTSQPIRNARTRPEPAARGIHCPLPIAGK